MDSAMKWLSSGLNVHSSITFHDYKQHKWPKYTLFQNNERLYQKHLNYSTDKFEKITHFIMFCLNGQFQTFKQIWELYRKRAMSDVLKARKRNKPNYGPRFLGSAVVVEFSGNLY